MPIGKNSIKRVANNGYSNVKTAAPDMENSEIVKGKTSAAKSTAKKSQPTKTAVKKETPKTQVRSSAKTPAQKASSPEIKKEQSVTNKKSDTAVRLGDDMPAYLL